MNRNFCDEMNMISSDLQIIISGCTWTW